MLDGASPIPFKLCPAPETVKPVQKPDAAPPDRTPTFAERLEAQNARFRVAEDDARALTSVDATLLKPRREPDHAARTEQEDPRLKLLPVAEQAERVEQRVEQVYRVTNPVTQKSMLDIFA